MSSRIEYEFYESLYRENVKLNEASYLFSLQMMISESTDLSAINEGYAEIVRGYMNKVMQNTQAAWNKFKEVISKAVSDTLLSKWDESTIRKALADESVEGVPITNYHDYDLDKLGNYSIKELNYGSMQGSLESVEGFLKANYQNIYEEKANLKDGLRKFITRKKVDSFTIGNDDMKVLADFVLDGYKRLQGKIQDNIDRLNRSADEVERMIQTNTSASESSILTLEDTNRIYFSEAEDDKEDEKMKIAAPEKKEGEEKGDANSTMKTHIMNYMKGTTKVLSAQMALSNEILILYSKILMKYMKNWDSGKKGKEESTKDTEEKSVDNSKIQKIK